MRGDEDSARDTEPERQVERGGLKPRESRLLTPSKLGKREAGELEKLEKGAEASGEYSWLPQVPFLAPLENWPTSLQVSFQKGGCPLGGDTRTPKSQIKKECRPPRKLLQEPQETRGSVGSPDKPVPDNLHNVVLDSEANLKVQKTQDLWSEAPNPARVEGQESPALTLSVFVVTVPITCFIINWLSS